MNEELEAAKFKLVNETPVSREWAEGGFWLSDNNDMARWADLLADAHGGSTRPRPSDQPRTR